MSVSNTKALFSYPNNCSFSFFSKLIRHIYFCFSVRPSLSVYLYASLYLGLTVCLSDCVSLCMFVFLSVCLSDCLSVCLYFCLSLTLSMFVDHSHNCLKTMIINKKLMLVLIAHETVLLKRRKLEIRFNNIRI